MIGGISRNVAWYTKWHMRNLATHGRTVESFRPTEDKKAENRARSRIINAANRLNVKVSTRVEWGEHGPRIVGTVRKEQDL